MYFICYWLLRFFVRLKLALLLPFRLKLIISSCKPLINFLIQTFSFVIWPIAIYLSSIIDVNTIFCFLFDYDTIALLRKK